VYDAIFEATASGATTLGDIRGFEPEKLRTAMLRMLIAERAIPMRERVAAAKPDPSARYAVPSVYNRMMLRRLASDTPLVMVSERAGTAFPTSAIEGLAIRALTEAEPGAREAWLRDFAGKHVLRLAVGDEVIETRDEQE